MWTMALHAVHDPEDFVDTPPEPRPLLALALGASIGIAGYGGAIHLAEGLPAAVAGGLRALLTAGAAWTLSIPALVVIGALRASTVPWRRAVLASLITMNFGGLAFLASVPVVMLLELANPTPWTRPIINTLVVGGVGLCSTVIFARLMARLEGSRLYHLLWMTTLGVLFIELSWLIDLFRFHL